MTYEERQKQICEECQKRNEYSCGYVIRDLQRKCTYLDDVMYGWELGQQDKKEPISEDLEEAAAAYVKAHGEILGLGKQTFKAGAQWQKQQDDDMLTAAYMKGAEEAKQQMMKDAVDVVFRNIFGEVIMTIDTDEVKLYPRGRYKAIIIKED